MNDQRQLNKEELQLVVFTVQNQEYALHIASVREIIHISKLIILPNLPLAMAGIINVRGSILPVVDLSLRFGLTQEQTLDFTSQKVLLVEMEETNSLIGCLMDDVLEVLQVPKGSLESFQKISGLDSGFINTICNLDGRLIPIIDSDKLLTSTETKRLESLAKERT